MTRYDASVATVRRLTPDIYSLSLNQPGLARRLEPGQFVSVRVGAGDDPVLRRPLSVADVDDNRLRLVFRVVGRGTAALARTRRGDVVDLLGPLGRPAPTVRNQDVLVCGGGVGAAPLLLLARRLIRDNRLTVVLGARSREQLILTREFRGLGARPLLATDDGSTGRRGTASLVAAEAASSLERPTVFACGPRAMLADLVRRLGPAPVWGFIEERMGCGTGICYCCALPRREGGYVRFCEEGPVVRLDGVRL